MASGTVPGTFADLQTAVNQANFGDVITVAATYTFVGPLNVGTPGGSSANGYAVVQTASSLPSSYSTVNVGGDIHPDYFQGTSSAVWVPGARVKPSQSNLMPKIYAPGSDLAAIVFGAGAKYWKFRGFEILPQTIDTVCHTFLVDIDVGALTTPFPDHIWFDQCYIHGWPDPGGATLHQGTRVQQAFQLAIGRCDITNCCLMEVKEVLGVKEAHAILWNSGPGPLSVMGSYVEGSTHCILVGGAGLATAQNPGSAVDSAGVGIRYQFNTFSRPLAWNQLVAGFVPPGGGGASGGWLVKVLTEFKTGENVFVDHNIYQYNWAGEQTGQAFSFNLATYGSSAVRIHNVTVQNNVIDQVAVAFELAINTESGIATVNQYPSGVTIKNNLVTQMPWQNEGPTDGAYYAPNAAPSPRTRDLYANQASNLTLDHNTFVDLLSSYDTDQGAAIELIYSGSSSNWPGLGITNNVMVDGQYGTWNTIDPSGNSTYDTLSTLNTYAPSANVAKNVLYGLGKTPTNILGTNATVNGMSAVGMSTGTITFPGAGRNGADLTFPTYAITAAGSSQYKGYATDGTNPGCDVSQLPWTASSPTPPFSTTSSITNSPISVTQGSNATVNVQVTSANGTPTGPVTLILNPGGSQQTFGPVNLTSGQATFSSPTFTTSGLSAGTYNLAANYAGVTGQWLASSGTGTLRVVGVQAAPTITITPTTVTWPMNLPITVQVSPPSGQSLIPTGTVTLSIDGVNIGQITLNTAGQAWFIVPNLNAGTRNLSIMYSGDSTYPGVTTPGTAVINPAACTMTVQGPPSINSGQNAAYTVTVTSP